ncbi:imidazole glycerol phosphate synthase subunit HisF [Pyrobaculum aerophilum]|uniref:Imidazole glycerol phosphate synthase subunit HisF n=1 Tax=Pyrobaculum aerophilum (strain ATCC 51768 / DSM 7523 / JCM 9630 / CIP 104966 / NBRC 100827 / IM2) TaxID=178306 RepID=HIS6_PYRAE|nr:RecName: Full=Imidazole glycerol phosphate synthase subunit HisF; AltName: Full=IGP synthase cyclase subunit; AltName: Full=IGP synthase subunit HisF; AltName: Full=ImGP synthase subunit HisF; Short=IGPS subunit HisF [Pyrobaculum aerophilum str. IM2]AAL63180.1 histidine biosynthesis protein (hisF,cyclase) [Pyrobaculum aerophilum str. IM2]
MDVALRIIPCLDIDGKAGVVVKGVNFQGIREVGDPVEMAVRYEEEGADEIAILDITAAPEGRATFIDSVKRVAEAVSIPVLVGGGVRSLEDATTLFRAGADKVSVNTAAVRNPQLVALLAREFGSQSTVVAIDAKWNGEYYEVYVKGGREATGLDAVKWAKEVEELGAGEILLTSIDRDGTGLGYDVELIRRVADSVRIPVIASGGAGRVEHFYEAAAAGADAVLAASLFHFRVLSIAQVKRYLKERGVEVRI